MKKVAVIKGDGVGPEVMDASLAILERVDPEVELIPCGAGVTYQERHGSDTLIPEETWRILEESDVCLKGPTTTPSGPGSPKSVAVSIRQHFDLYANVRPITTDFSVEKPLGDIELVCVRENTEGLYFGVEMEMDEDTYLAIRRVKRSSCRRIARYAFEEAKRRKWDTVVAIHKSNILKQTCGVFVEETRRISQSYPEIDLWEYHVDDIAQQIIKNPQNLDKKILLSTNLFMDIISEECAALVGSIGLIYSENIGENYAMFEPAHGSAPKYAGMNKVNPTATILASAAALEYLGMRNEANIIREATKEVIAEHRTVTYDLGGDANLSDMADAIQNKIRWQNERK